MSITPTANGLTWSTFSASANRSSCWTASKRQTMSARKRGGNWRTSPMLNCGWRGTWPAAFLVPGSATYPRCRPAGCRPLWCSVTLGALFARLGHLPNRPNGVVIRLDDAKGQDCPLVHVTEWSSRGKRRPKAPENGSNVQLEMCSPGSVIAEPGSRCQKSNTYYQSLILHNNAGPLGTAASLHAALADPQRDAAGGAVGQPRRRDGRLLALSGDRGWLCPAAGGAGAGDRGRRSVGR